MISPQHLSIVMWTVVAGWAATTVLVLIDFEWRSRRERRALALVARLSAAGGDSGASLPDVTRSEFETLIHAGLPQPVEAALARQVRAHEGDAMLLAFAHGSKPATIDDRLHALQVLVSGRHPDSYEALAAALRSRQIEVVAMALRLLRELNDQRAVDVLVAALAAGAASPSRVAAVIDRMTVERGPYLGGLLKHGNPTVRFWGLLLVGRAGTSQWLDDVRRLVTDASPQVRRAAVEVLGRLHHPDDHARVQACLADPVPMVRVHAARAAAAFSSVTMSHGLVGLLSDREWVVRAAARDSLCHMGASATEAVTRTLWEGDLFAANNAAEVLFLTGATGSFIARLLQHPHDQTLRRLVERLIAASGPQISRAVYDRLEPHDQAELKRILAAVPTVTSERAS